jgi:PAS domain S-box-containing protein
MRDKDKTREELIAELAKMRQRIAELEATEPQRKRAEEALRESEERFRTIFAQSPVGIEIYDASGKLIDANPACLEMFGVENVEAVRGFDLLADPNMPPEASSRLEQGESVQYETVFDFELVRQRALYRTSRSGQFFADCLIVPLRASDHSITGYLVHVRDITERKRAEEALRESEERFRKVFEEGPIGMVLTNHDLKFFSANPTFCQMLGYTAEEMSSKTFLDVTHPAHRDADRANVQKMWQGEIPSYRTEKRYIAKNGDVRWGNLSASLIRGQGGEPLCALAIVEDITESKRAEEALRESAERLSGFMDSATDGFILFDSEMNVVEINRSALKIFGVGRDAIGKNAVNVSPDVVESGRYDKYMEVMKTGKPFFADDVVPHRKFGDIYLAIRAFKVGDGLGTIVTNITDRKRAEEALRDSRRMLQTVLDSIPSAVFWKDRDSIYLGANRALLEAVGLKSSEEIVGKSDYDLPGGKKQADSFREDDRRVMESGIPKYDIIEPYLRADGTHAWAKTNKVPLRDTEGNVVGILGTSEDITERKRAEEDRDRLFRAIEIAKEAVSIQSSDLVTVYANNAMYELFGYEKGELIGTHISILNAEAMSDAMVEQIVDALQKDGYWEGEVHNKRKDGSEFLTYATTTAIKDKEGRVINFISTQHDITKRKRAEEEIKQRNRELATLLDVSQRLASQLDLDELLNTVVHSIVDTLPAAEAASLWLYDERRNELVVHAWAGHDDEAIAGLALSPDTSRVGLVYHSHQPYIADDIAREPAFEPLGRPALDAVRSVLGVPLLIEGRPIGALFADNFSRVQAFDESDVRLLQSLAGQAAIAIENARLYEQVQAGRERLRQLTRQVVSAQEEERRRLSRELHDELGQALTGIVFDLAGIEKELPSDVAPTVRERLAEASSLAAQADERVSELALDLRPYMLDDLGLVSALRWYVNRYARRVDIEVEMEAIDLDERLTPEVETALYRVVQEALTNVSKHAQANKVKIRLERTEAAVAAIVEDDGQGFDVETIAGPAAPKRGAGLLGIRERVTSLGGSVGIRSTKGHGTRLTIEIPL